MADERYLNILKRTNVDIKDTATLNRFLQENMPGNWSKMHLTKLFQKLPGNKDFFQKDKHTTECVQTIPSEVDRLLNVMNLKDIKTILEPFDGTGTISSCLKKKLNNVNIITNDIVPEHGNPDICENALDSKLYLEHGPFDAIITSPWFCMNDIAFPRMLKYCNYFLAMHLPSYYICNAPSPRLKFIKKLANEKRICVISDMPRDNPTRMSCIWLIVFKHHDYAKRFLKNNDTQIPFIF
jgi:hypothetical protein